MHAFTQLRFDRLERGTHTFGHRMSMDGEPTLCASLGTLAREAKNIETFRSALPASFTSFDRIAAELDQTHLPLVQLRTKLGEPCAEILQTRHRFAVVLEPYHEVIRIAYYDHIASAAVFPPPLDPKVKDMVQIHVGKER